ncbi:MAG: type II secretion system F family protein [Phycisphaerales bacterium]
MPQTTVLMIVSSLLTFVSVYMLVRYGYAWSLVLINRQELAYDRVLRRQLLIDIEPRTALGISAGLVVTVGLFAFVITYSIFAAFACAAAAMLLPNFYIRHLEAERLRRLESQLVDGLTTLAAAARAGLNLVQSMELLETNAVGPIKQEFGQLLREYRLGMDLNQAMQNASNRIGSQLYRLTFTAIQMHRLRGGDTAQSLDRIADSIRDIARLEAKLDALTSQARYQAIFMSMMPVVFLVLLWSIDPEGVGMLFTVPAGRILLLIVVALIVVAFVWIRKIMAVDI